MRARDIIISGKFHLFLRSIDAEMFRHDRLFDLMCDEGRRLKKPCPKMKLNIILLIFRENETKNGRPQRYYTAAQKANKTIFQFQMHDCGCESQIWAAGFWTDSLFFIDAFEMVYRKFHWFLIWLPNPNRYDSVCRAKNDTPKIASNESDMWYSRSINNFHGISEFIFQYSRKAFQWNSVFSRSYSIPST